MRFSGAKGFTLIEILVTFSVLAILLTLAAPSVRALVRNNRLTGVTNDLVTSLSFARSEAVKRGARVSICKSANPGEPSPVCSTAANWQQGWLVFVDNSGVIGDFDGTDVRLRVGQPNAGNAVVTPDVIFQNFVSYLSNGASSGSANIVVCLEGVSRTISINNTGRVQTSSGTCS